MKMHVAVSVVLSARYVIWRKKMSEPRLEDDVALGINQDCDECEQSEDECTCGDAFEPDRLEDMWDE